MKITVELVTDWALAKEMALFTQGKKSSIPASREFRREMIRTHHSPLETVIMKIKVFGLPYYSAMHFRTHTKFFIRHFIKSQRVLTDRGSLRQDNPTNWACVANVPAVREMLSQRLCADADATTARIAAAIREQVLKVLPELKDELLPTCQTGLGCTGRTVCKIIK